ncbi:ribosome maturation factor RimM [uncultured Tyzzerella sp.]|uniref:ribosome maturation factor RimM n=1 Tax=uncultured Tyzzerella sp. TaxID=2321398 RepID=UPI002942EFEB|nr:ribosome maturation factor RimM [uncultured Tyzzerella sp.]
MSDYFVIGKIVNTQGIKGEVRVLPTTDDINRFKKLKEVYISKRSGMDLYEIESTRFHKQFVLLKFKGIDTMNDAELIKNTEIKISKDLAIPCEEDEYYIGDLYGMEVFTDEGENIGTIEDIIFTGANDVYLVKKDDSQILIPAIKQCILNVDVKEKTMKVHLLEGLR